MNRNCSACNIKIDTNNYKKDRTVCKICNNKNKRKNNNTLTQNHQPKTENDNIRKKIKVADSVKINNNNNRTLMIGFSNCGKTFLMNHFLFQKQELIFILTKSLNQNPDIKAQTSDEIEPLENYENSTVVSDDMLLSKQESNIDLFFTRGRHYKTDINYISRSYFHLPKNTIRNNSNIIVFVKQSLRDIILIFHDIAGLDMNLEGWKQLCHKAWENDYVYLQIDRFAKIGRSRYTIKNCNKTTYIECTPETKPF